MFSSVDTDCPSHDMGGGVVTDEKAETRAAARRLIAQRMRKDLDESGHTVSSIAAQMGVSAGTVRSWVAGRRAPGPENSAHWSSIVGGDAVDLQPMAVAAITAQGVVSAGTHLWELLNDPRHLPAF